jgi:acyl-CoA synthetase (NDP forming)
MEYLFLTTKPYSPDEAEKTANGLSHPVAVKIVSPDVIHKSDAGALRVGGNDGHGVIAVPAKFVTQVTDDARTKKVRLAVVIAAGFRETGDEDKSLEAEVLEKAKELGMRMLDSNCRGATLPHKAINATFGPSIAIHPVIQMGWTASSANQQASREGCQ